MYVSTKPGGILMSDTILENEIMEFHKELDARGLNCPLPILKAKKALTELQSGYVKAARTLRAAGLPSGHP